MRRCWTCNQEHDIDEACRIALVCNSTPGNRIVDDLIDDAPSSRLGPVFRATFESEDACCGEGIVPGEDIRADGSGGWIHADTTCEKLAS
jgi:hypothetical protein